MLILADVRDWIKKLGIGEHFYVGKLDNKKEKSIGIYQRKENGPPGIALGGLKNTKYGVLRASVLIHWNKNSTETEIAARSLFDKLLETTNLKVGETHVAYVHLQVPEPQDVGTDDAGVYERVIWFDLYYER